jgi:hypothetical protein
MSFARAAAITLAALLLTPALAAPVQAAESTLPPTKDCTYGSPEASKTAADKIMARHLQLWSHPDWILPTNPTWREQPFNGDLNWLFNYHALRWLLPLFQTGHDTADPAYTDRATFLMKDWLASNPRTSTATAMAWNDMAAGWRASILACAVGYLGQPTWLATGLRNHGTALADPKFYSYHGNHALNQVIGLIDVACVLVNSTWKTLSASRISTLVLESVDSEGATNEQAIGYQLYNYDQYERARRHLTNCGMAVPSAFSRVLKMPELLAYATAPDGTYAQLGDTDLTKARVIPGTLAEYAATAGASGPKPPVTIRRYKAGYLFARSGWGETRPFADELYVTQRYGPGLGIHGQHDGQSITLSAKGRRLLVDPGKYTYTPGIWKTYFESRAAHNVVVVDSLKYDARKATAFGSQTKANVLYTSTRNTGYAGVTNRRRMIWSRGADYLIVDDTLSATVTRTFRQTWHLPRSSAPTISGNRLDTHLTGGNIAIVQLVGRPALRVITGQTSPVQGWVSEAYQVKYKAPVLQASVTARSARFLTLLVPYSGARPAISGRVVSLTSTGYIVDVTIGTHTERVTINTSGASIVKR